MESVKNVPEGTIKYIWFRLISSCRSHQQPSASWPLESCCSATSQGVPQREDNASWISDDQERERQREREREVTWLLIIIMVTRILHTVLDWESSCSDTKQSETNWTEDFESAFERLIPPRGLQAQQKAERKRRRRRICFTFTTTFFDTNNKLRFFLRRQKYFWKWASKCVKKNRKYNERIAKQMNNKKCKCFKAIFQYLQKNYSFLRNSTQRSSQCFLSFLKRWCGAEFSNECGAICTFP